MSFISIDSWKQKDRDPSDISLDWYRMSRGDKSPMKTFDDGSCKSRKSVLFLRGYELFIAL